MKNFILGFVFATMITFSLGFMFQQPKIVGGSGKLEGVEVVGADGRKLCMDPNYYEANRVVSCH